MILEIQYVNQSYIDGIITQPEWFFKVLDITTEENVDLIISSLENESLSNEFITRIINSNFPKTQEGWKSFKVGTVNIFKEGVDVNEVQTEAKLNLMKVVPLLKEKLKIETN